MKKLLAMLGTISIVSLSTTTVIACGKPDSPTIDPEIPETPDYQKLLEELKIKINALVQTIYSNNVKKLSHIKNSGTDTYKFLNSTKLDDLLGEKMESDLKLEGENKDNLINDLNEIYGASNINKEIKDFADANEEYSIFLNGIDSYFRTFVIKDDTIKITKIKEVKSEEPETTTKTEEDAYYYQVRFNINIQWNYTDSDKNPQIGTTSDYKVVFTLFNDDDGIYELINQIQNTLPQRLFKKKSLLKINSEQLTKNGLQKKFGAIEPEIINFVKTETFMNPLEAEITNIINEEIISADLSTKNFSVDSVDVNGDYANFDLATTQKLSTVNIFDSKFSSNVLFDPNAVETTEEKIEIMNDEIGQAFDDSIFVSELEYLFKKNNVSEELISSDWDKVIKKGAINVSGISLILNTNEEFEIPSLFFDYTYEISDNDSTKTRKELLQLEVIQNIESWQNVMQMKKATKGTLFDITPYVDEQSGYEMFNNNRKKLKTEKILEFSGTEGLNLKVIETTQSTNFDFWINAGKQNENVWEYSEENGIIINNNFSSTSFEFKIRIGQFRIIASSRNKSQVDQLISIKNGNKPLIGFNK